MNVLAFVWLGIIGLGIILYVVLDGFDLGLGIVSLFIQDHHERDIAISSILPVWDGNETWLVFGGAALYGAFPLAFSTLLPILYLPILVMVIALLFRGVAFEFRLKAHKSKPFWDKCFFTGSLLATLMQGMILGSFIEGYELHKGYILYQWLSPFSVFCGVALVFGYCLLGVDRLIIKTTGRLQNHLYAISKKLQYTILVAAVIVSIWTPYVDPDIHARWYNPHLMPILSLFPIITATCFILHVYGIRHKKEHIPFYATIAMFLLCYLGFVVSVYPFIVPRDITFLQASAANHTLVFMLVGAAIMLPLLLAYTFYAYFIFRGKITKPLQY